jgi:hypothetical protein
VKVRKDFDSFVEVVRKKYGKKNNPVNFRVKIKICNKTRRSFYYRHRIINKKTHKTGSAYPNANSVLKESFALDAFIKNIDDSAIRLSLRQCCSKSIAESEILATRLKTYKLVERQRLQTTTLAADTLPEQGIE